MTYDDMRTTRWENKKERDAQCQRDRHPHFYTDWLFYSRWFILLEKWDDFVGVQILFLFL